MNFETMILLISLIGLVSGGICLHWMKGISDKQSDEILNSYKS